MLALFCLSLVTSCLPCYSTTAALTWQYLILVFIQADPRIVFGVLVASQSILVFKTVSFGAVRSNESSLPSAMYPSLRTAICSFEDFRHIFSAALVSRLAVA